MFCTIVLSWSRSPNTSTLVAPTAVAPTTEVAVKVASMTDAASPVATALAASPASPASITVFVACSDNCGCCCWVGGEHDHVVICGSCALVRDGLEVCVSDQLLGMRIHRCSVTRGVPSPILVRKVCALAASAEHALLVDECGHVYSWGRAQEGQLGRTVCRGDKCKRRRLSLCAEQSPHCVEALRDQHVRIRAVSVSDTHSLFLSHDGALYACGDNKHGQCGVLCASSTVMLPTRVNFIASIEVAEISGSSEPHGNADNADDGVEGNAEERQFEDVSCGVRIAHIDCSCVHGVAVSTTGLVYTWGSGLYGALGHGDTESEPVPRCVAVLMRSHHVTHAACGIWNSVFITRRGLVLSCGWNKFGQLGFAVDSVNVAASPRCVALPGSQFATKAHCGSRHSVITCSNGDVLGFGWAGRGQLGDYSPVMYRVNPSGASIAPRSIIMPVPLSFPLLLPMLDADRSTSAKSDQCSSSGVSVLLRGDIVRKWASQVAGRPVRIKSEVACGRWSTHVAISLYNE